eukprot:1136333-Pelagomonas_calceolata.AAC.6
MDDMFLRFATERAVSCTEGQAERLLILHGAHAVMISMVYGLPAFLIFKNGELVPGCKREGAVNQKMLADYIKQFGGDHIVHAAEKLAGEAEVTMLQTREFREAPTECPAAAFPFHGSMQHRVGPQQSQTKRKGIESPQESPFPQLS